MATANTQQRLSFETAWGARRPRANSSTHVSSPRSPGRARVANTGPGAPSELRMRALGGTLRRECLDFLIPIYERHLKMTIKEWILHYNRGRSHSSLGPGIPEPSQDGIPASHHRHKLPTGYRVVKTSVLGGLHDEYRLVKEVA